MAKISIIMPAYNSALFIAESIQSILEQTYRDWELIIIDDGSSDNTASIVQQYAKDYGNIIFHQQVNQGQAIARNNGLALSTGELIAFLDSDDLWDPQAMQTLYDTLQREQADFVFCSFNRLENGQLNPEKLNEFPSGKLSAEQMLAILALYNPLVIHGVLTWRRLVMEAGGFENQAKLLNCSEDYNLWLRIALQGHSFFGLPIPLVTYRRHAAGTHTNRIKMLEAEIFVHRKYMQVKKPALLITKRLLRAKYRQLISAYLYARQTPMAEAAFRQLMEYDRDGFSGRLVSLFASLLPFPLAHAIGTKLLYPLEYRLMNLLYGRWNNALANYKDWVTRGA